MRGLRLEVTRSPPSSEDGITGVSPLELLKGQSKRPSILVHALSGTIGSLVAECLLFPVETIKLQVMIATGGGATLAGVFARIASAQGLRGFYKGLRVSIVKECVHSLNFWLWHGLVFRRLVKYKDTSMTHPLKRLFLNMGVKQLNWLCTVPFEVISQTNQLAMGDPGFFLTAARLYEKGGLSNFYRGLPVSLLLAINPAIMHTLITSLLRMAALARQAWGLDYFEAREHGATSIASATAISKLIATVITYPLIRVKVLQQTHGRGQGIWRTLLAIATDGGFRGLYRGLGVVTMKAVMWNSVMMAFKHILGPPRHQTPPGSPRALDKIPLEPVMGRETFPVQLLTEAKFQQILSYVTADGKVAQVRRRVDRIDKRMDDVCGEVREVRHLLAELLTAASSQQSPRFSAGPQSPESSEKRKPFGNALAEVRRQHRERPHVHFSDSTHSNHSDAPLASSAVAER